MVTILDLQCGNIGSVVNMLRTWALNAALQIAQDNWLVQIG